MTEKTMDRELEHPATEPWLWRTNSSVLAIVFILSSLFLAYVLLLAGPEYALPTSVAAFWIYLKGRFGEKGHGFGPLWLKMVDMGVLFNNADVFLFSIFLLVKRWLAQG